MEDLQDKIIELMDLFDGEVTTADKIDIPKPREDVQTIEAINNFMKRNPQADGGRIPFDNGGEALKQKYLQQDYAKYGKDKLEEATKILLSDDFGRTSSSVTNSAIQDAKRLGLNTYENLPKELKAKIRNQINKYGRVIPESEARLLGRKEKTATDRAATPTKGARIVKGNFTRNYTTSELINLSEKGLFDPYKNKFAEGVPEKVLVKDRIVDIEFSDPETKKKFFEDFEKRFKYLRGSKQVKKLGIDNAGLYKKYLSNLEPKTAELALAGLRNSLIEKTIASGGDESKYFYRTMGINEKGKSNIVRGEKIDKAAKKAGKGVADINKEQKKVVKLLNEYYKNNPEELLKNTKLRNLLDLTLKDGELVRKNKYVTDKDFLELIKKKKGGLFTIDHVDEVQFEKLSTEFPVFKQLATYNTNSGLIRSIKSYVAKNQNSTDPVVQDKIKKQIAFLEDLKLRVDTPTGRVGSKEVLAAVDRKAGVLPNFLAQLRALNIKLPGKAKAALLGIGGGLGLNTFVSAGPIEETGSTAIDTAKTVGAGTAGALAVGTKKGRNILGRTIGGAFGPTGLAGLTVAGGGYDLSSPLDRFLLGTEAAFAPELVKGTIGATKGMKNRALQKVVQRALNLGMSVPTALKVARVASPLGIMGMAVEGTVKGAKDTMAAAKEIDAIPDENLQQQEYDNLIRNIVGYAKGGRAGFKLGTVRKMVQTKIDEAVEQSPKDTTSALDKLIKKALNEDFFDKKDAIIDTLNAKIARERKNFPYNQQVFEEPSQLEFYDDITKSNFKTKTGEYFDRIRRRNKAGGGILKQAGDRSGPPPESGPNPQGLQGLLNRVKKV